MEKSWNFETMAKSRGKVVEFDKRALHVYKKNPTNQFCAHSVSLWSLKSHGILSRKFLGNPVFIDCEALASVSPSIGPSLCVS